MIQEPILDTLDTHIHTHTHTHVRNPNITIKTVIKSEEKRQKKKGTTTTKKKATKIIRKQLTKCNKNIYSVTTLNVNALNAQSKDIMWLSGFSVF